LFNIIVFATGHAEFIRQHVSFQQFTSTGVLCPFNKRQNLSVVVYLT